MTTPDPGGLLALAGQVERLTDGDREIDARIWCVAGTPVADFAAAFPRAGEPNYSFPSGVPPYTSDPAAALGLVERAMPGKAVHAGWQDFSSLPGALASPPEAHAGLYLPFIVASGRGPSLPGRFARAVTALALRAMAEAPEPADT